MEQRSKLRRCSLHKGSVLRIVLLRLQPLREICYSKTTQMIRYTCRNRLDEIFDFDRNKNALKDYYSQLPGTIREKLLENLSEKYQPEMYPFNLYLDEVLFSKGMRKLMFLVGDDCRQNHLDIFFSLASVEGKGLRSLKFYRTFFCPIHFNVTPITNENLKKTLASAEHLVDLELTSICDDAVMKMIGENCTRLQKLKLSSARITAKGIHYLTQSFVRHPMEIKEKSRIWKSTVWELPGIFPPLEELLPVGEPVKFYERMKSSLCSTLKVVDIDVRVDNDCFVGSEPMLALMELIPGLQSVGSHTTYYFVQELWKKWFRCFKRKDYFLRQSFNLTSLDLGLMDDWEIDVIIAACPKLQRIHYYYAPSTFSLSSFNHFVQLQALHIMHITSTLITDSFGDLSLEIRKRLTSVKINNPLAGKSFDVSDIHACSELCLLNLSFSYISWSDQVPPRDTMGNLSTVELRGKVTCKALFSILECAPNLEHLTVGDVIDRNEDFFHLILRTRKMSKLKTFEVLEGFLLDTEDEVRSFVTHFESIEHFGKVRFLSN